jgi:hypothetical protein
MIRISRRLSPAALAIGLVVALGGCDPNAKTNSGDSAKHADRLSKVYESCGTTSHCEGDLRCFDHVCRSIKASVVGDYHAAVGERALAAGEVEVAVKAYTDAVNRYESDKIDTPLAVLCGKGRALTAARAERERAEEAALTLHQCLNAAPVGSSVRRQALADLAVLGQSGLNPELLAREELVREYLTLQPAGPSSADIKVTATGTAKAGSRGHDEILALIQGQRDALIPCWETNYKANKSKSLSVTVEMQSKFQQGEYEEDDGYRLVLRSPEPAAGTAERCVYDVIVPAADAYGKANRRSLKSWDSSITVTLQ